MYLSSYYSIPDSQHARFYIYRFLFIEEAYLAYFTTIIYHKVLINNTTEQDTEQDTTYRYDQRSRMPTPVAL